MPNLNLSRINDIYPTGVLFLLARMGKNDKARNVFEGYAIDHPLMKDINLYIRFATLKNGLTQD